MIEIYCKNIFSPFIKDYKLYGFYDKSLTIKDLKIIILGKINIEENKYTNIEFINDTFQYYHDNKILTELEFNSKIYINYYLS